MTIMFDLGPPPLQFRAFAQSDAYAAAARACGAKAFRVDLGCGEALVLERAGRRLVTRGPVWAEGTTGTQARRALRRLARFAGVLMATPEDGAVAGLGLVPLVTPAHVAVWDLQGDLRAGLGGKWRNRLVAAERAGVRTGQGSTRALDRLLVAEAAMRAARGYRTHPAAFTRALPMAALRLFTWQHGGDLGAGMAFVLEGSVATYHLGWGNAASRAAHVHPLILFRAACSLRAEGARWLDLGSVDTEGAPGLARFKLGTGADLRRLGPTMWVLPG